MLISLQMLANSLTVFFFSITILSNVTCQRKFYSNVSFNCYYSLLIYPIYLAIA